MTKLSKTRELTQSDFITTQEGGFEFNNVILKTVAEFYEVNDQEKKTLFDLNKGFKEVTEKMKKREISVPEYLKEIEKLNALTKSAPNINIGMNKKDAFVITIKADLKKQYQTTKQLASNPAPVKKPAIFALYGIEWEESERGWGVRPDGFSFHRTPEEAKKYIKDYWDKQPKGEAPDEYSRPSSETPRLIEVSEGLHDYVMENGSVWLVPNSASAYKTYDASHLKKPKNKM